MEPLPPIPTPAAQRWREFRVRFLPLIVFAAVLVGVVILWKNYVAPAAIVGQVETNTVNIFTTTPGLLSGITVQQFQDVKAGDILAIVSPFSPEATKAAMNAVESDVKVIQARMMVNEVQSLDAGAKLRLDLLLQKTLLSIAKVKLEEFETVLNRTQILFDQKVFSQAQLDIAKANRDGAKAEVTERGHLVKQWEDESEMLLPRRIGSVTNTVTLIEQDIMHKQEEIRQLQKPIELRAPIDGRVSAIRFLSGQNVSAGVPILSITPLRPAKIVGYVRQPITYHPKVGDAVTVSTRTVDRRSSPAQVIRVGAQLETISLLMLPIDRTRVEQGLPIAITLPAELGLLPGELVDIHINSQKN